MKNQSKPAETAVIFAAVLIAACAMFAAFYPWQGSAAQPTGSIWPDDGSASPAVFIPAAPPQIAERLHLELALPPLSDSQLFWQRAAEIIPSCPLCKGLDLPPIPLTDDERAVFVALLYTESNLRPYDEAGDLVVSEAGCVGIAQLCGFLLTFETRDNQMLAIYTAADYFKQMLTEEDGDYLSALKRYKGSTTDDTTEQADRTFDYLRLKAGKR